jgi:hypothetical protein
MAAGGQQLGTVWGHGSYVAPDWSADWLHREAGGLQSVRLQQQAVGGRALAATDRAAVDALVRDEMRRNTYDEAAGTIVVSPTRAQVIREVAHHYEGLFGSDPGLAKLRDAYAMTEGALPEQAQREALAAFFSGPRGPPPPTAPAKPASRTPATGRTSRSSATRCPRRPRCGRWPASSCCWPASRRCCGCTGATSTRRRPHRRPPTRCSAPAPRRR